MSGHRFIDTNIWLYALIESKEVQKRSQAKQVIQDSGLVVSTQVINETCVNLLRKAAFPEGEIQRLILAFYEKCNVVDVDVNTLLQASQLRERYSFSFWDSLIVASALVTNCDTLYSEDMQDGLKVQDKFVVVNPFTS